MRYPPRDTPRRIRVGRSSHNPTLRADGRGGYSGQNRPSVCQDCGTKTISGPNGPLRRHCDDCSSEYESEKARAHNAVHRAIKYGRLSPPTDFQCVDCGLDAVVHDHRDYRKPLEVDPVCKRCNKLRLGALWSRSAPLPVEPLPYILAPDCAAHTLVVPA